MLDTVLAAPAVAEDSDFGPGDGLTRLVVTVLGGITAEQLIALEQVTGVESAQTLFDGSALVAGDGTTPEQLRAVVPGAEVTLSVPGQVAGRVGVTDPAWSSYGWNLENTGTNAYNQAISAGADVAAPAGWAAGTGRGMTVAIIDTGIMTTHPDLAGSVWTNPGEACGSVDTDHDGHAGDCHGWNFYKNSADVTNAGGDNSHGTGVAGVAGARAGNGEGSAGVAPDVTIMPLVIGSGGAVDLSLGAEAIRYAADHGADVVNASWGGEGASTVLSQAIAYADSKGVVVVAAAGNDALNRDTSMFYPASLNAENLIKVGNSTATDTMSTSSAYGARSVDLFAPGNLVYTTKNNGNYWLVSGTSIAAPHVAAAAALYRAADRDATPAQLKARLLADVTPVPAFAGKSVTGGRLSLAALGRTAAPVHYSFTGMTAEPGTVSPRIVATGTAPAGDYQARLSLGMEHQGTVYALADQPITVGGVATATDSTGEVAIDLGYRAAGLGSLVLDPDLHLEEGRYVLSAQLFRDGTALGVAYAAPLLVGQQAQQPDASTPTPSTPTPDNSTPSTPTPSTPTPDNPTPDNSTPGNQTPGNPAPGQPSPGTTSPGGAGPEPEDGSPSPGSATPAPEQSAQQPGGTPPTSPATPSPGDSGNPAPDDTTRSNPTPGNSSPADMAPGDTDPGATAPLPSIPADPVVPSPATPDLGGQKDYPEVGAARLTSIAPARVSTAGGTVVTVTGVAIPTGARVRIGNNSGVRPSTVSSTQLTFTTPSLVAGVYDVYVFAPDGTQSVLPAGLTYVAPDGSSPLPPGVDDPSNDDPGSDEPGPSIPPSTGGAEPVGVTGPHGERLVRSARFAALGGGIWRLDCARACEGLPF